MLRLIRANTESAMTGIVADAVCRAYWLEWQTNSSQNAASIRGISATTQRLARKASGVTKGSRYTYDLLYRALTEWNSLSSDDKKDLKEHAMLLKDIAQYAYDLGLLALKGVKPHSVLECKEIVSVALVRALNAAHVALFSFPIRAFRECVARVSSRREEQIVQKEILFDRWGVIEPTARPRHRQYQLELGTDD